jgi:hypothetical protein
MPSLGVKIDLKLVTSLFNRYEHLMDMRYELCKCLAFEVWFLNFVVAFLLNILLL